MCCFSRKVDLVAATNLFARASDKGKQFLVYSMTMKAAEELAMILPIPTPKGSAEEAVRFINLEKYPAFFTDLHSNFPQLAKPAGRGPAQNAPAKHELKVVEVGSFVASFVPAVKDFERLDAQFRLPPEVWEKLPQYADHGFAVFKLKSGEKKVHPMAFEFPRANPKKLFFPTVHIHDGEVHAKADFDHSLFCQPSGDETPAEWEESAQPAGLFMKMDKAQGILDEDSHVYLLRLRGNLKNVDTLL